MPRDIEGDIVPYELIRVEGPKRTFKDPVRGEVYLEPDEVPYWHVYYYRPDKMQACALIRAVDKEEASRSALIMFARREKKEARRQ